MNLGVVSMLKSRTGSFSSYEIRLTSALFETTSTILAKASDLHLGQRINIYGNAPCLPALRPCFRGEFRKIKEC